MARPKPTFVVVGANLTGGAAVSTLRQEGFDGRVVLVGEEPDPPYERPPLSKEYLRGESDFEQALLRPPEWYRDNEVELWLGVRAERVEPARRRVELAGGEAIPYDKVLVATGGRNRRLRVPGSDLQGVLDLRTRADADRIREAAAGAGKAVVVGAGFIGCEVAASLRHLGLEVEVVEVFEVPLQRAVGPEVGRVLEAVHRDHGVVFHLGQAVVRFEGSGRVERVVTNRDTVVEGDLVVVGVGIVPNTEPVAEAGVALDNGVVVDELCRTTVEGVFAAGDVANHFHPLFGRHVRVEHWDNALKQGAAAARSMLGRGTPYDDPHWFWSDQYDVNLQYLGVATEWDQLVVRGSLEERQFLGFYLKDGVVQAVVGMNRGRDVRRCVGLVRARRPVEPGLLRDEDVDLRELGSRLEAGG